MATAAWRGNRDGGRAAAPGDGRNPRTAALANGGGRPLWRGLKLAPPPRQSPPRRRGAGGHRGNAQAGARRGPTGRGCRRPAVARRVGVLLVGTAAPTWPPPRPVRRPPPRGDGRRGGSGPPPRGHRARRGVTAPAAPAGGHGAPRAGSGGPAQAMALAVEATPSWTRRRGGAPPARRRRLREVERGVGRCQRDRGGRGRTRLGDVARRRRRQGQDTQCTTRGVHV